MDWSGIGTLQNMAKTSAQARRAGRLYNIDMEAIRILNDVETEPDANARYSKARQHVVNSMLPEAQKRGFLANLVRSVEPPPNMMSEFQRGLFAQSRAGIYPDGQTGPLERSVGGQKPSFETPTEQAERRRNEAMSSYYEGSGRQTYRRSAFSELRDLEEARALYIASLKRANPDITMEDIAKDKRYKSYEEGILNMQNRLFAPPSEQETVPVEMSGTTPIQSGQEWPPVPSENQATGDYMPEQQRRFQPTEAPTPTRAPQQAFYGGEATTQMRMAPQEIIDAARQVGATDDDLSKLTDIINSGDDQAIQKAIQIIQGQGR